MHKKQRKINDPRHRWALQLSGSFDDLWPKNMVINGTCEQLHGVCCFFFRRVFPFCSGLASAHAGGSCSRRFWETWVILDPCQAMQLKRALLEGQVCCPKGLNWTLEVWNPSCKLWVQRNFTKADGFLHMVLLFGDSKMAFSCISHIQEGNQTIYCQVSAECKPGQAFSPNATWLDFQDLTMLCVCCGCGLIQQVCLPEHLKPFKQIFVEKRIDMSCRNTSRGSKQQASPTVCSDARGGLGERNEILFCFFNRSIFPVTQFPPRPHNTGSKSF